MILLDTDHINILQSLGPQAAALRANMAASADQEFATTAITVEEQMRGWLALVHRYSDVQRQVPAYERLVDLFGFFSRWDIAAFDGAVAREFNRLRGQGVRIGTMDLKIAATTLAHGALLLTANLRDFGQVPDLRAENWLVSRV
ncbi:MAG: type II toxin-antitoxin system VapC family toxin [Thermoguttaceae bacterium]